MSSRLLISCVAALLLAFPTSAHAKRRHKSKRNVSSVSSSNQTPVNEALERIYRIQDKRLVDPYLKSSVYHPSSKVVKAAILAMGRIGDPSAVEELSKIVNRKNKEYQRLAAFSLGLIGSDIALKILEQQVQWQKDSELRGALLRGIGLAGKETSVKLLSRIIQGESHPVILESSLEALGLLWSGDSEKWEVPEGLIARLLALSRSPASYNVIAAFALARFKGDPAKVPVNDLLTAVVGTPSAYARGFLIRVLGKIKNTQVGTFLATLSLSGTDLAVRIEAVKALMRQSPMPGVLAALKQLLGEPSPVLVVAALETTSAYGRQASGLSSSVQAIVKAGPWVQVNAMRTLARIHPEAARTKLTESSAQPFLSEAAVLQTLASLADSGDLERMAALFPASSTRNLVEALDLLNALPEGSFPSAFREALKKLAERNDPGIVYEAASLAERNRWKDFAPVLVAAYKSFSTVDALEGKVAVLSALGVIGDITHIPFLEGALKEDDRLVVEAAARALKNIAGKEIPVPLNSTVSEEPLPLQEIQAAVGVSVTLQTSRGEVQIRTTADAPITAARILRLVRAKFYDGKTFHRVVPNFVVQGGDPRGDGFGGPGFLMRDEVGPARHIRGTVGIATAGKDTGGCQFFFNLAPNLHLDGRYTLFAEITRGLDVAEKLEVGDQIISARVK